jgi:hypothetical protein
LPGAHRAVSVHLGVNLLKGVRMKARLAVLVVAVALAIAGAFGVAPSRAALSEDSPAVAVAIEPQIQPDQQLQVDPGGWWDWH